MNGFLAILGWGMGQNASKFRGKPFVCPRCVNEAEFMVEPMGVVSHCSFCHATYNVAQTIKLFDDYIELTTETRAHDGMENKRK